MWLAEKILYWLLGKAATAVQEHAAEVARDEERGKINEDNVKAYEDSKNRAERRQAALDLLNRSKR